MWKQFEFWCEGVFFSGLGIFGIVANFASIITFLSPEVRIIVSVTFVITVIIVIFLCSWNWSPRWGSKHSTSYWLVSPFVKSCEFFHLISTQTCDMINLLWNHVSFQPYSPKVWPKHTVYIIHCIFYSVYYILYFIHCILYILYWIIIIYIIIINALFSVPNTVLGRKYRNLLKLNFSFLANVKSKPTFSPFHQSWIKASN